MNNVDQVQIDDFRQLVLDKGCELYRDLAWRNTRDPYAVWVSEVMLQQTQVVRVEGRWERWLTRFPTVEALAAADTADVLSEWQGMGYNRRALSLQKAAQRIVAAEKDFPCEVADLVALPGIGPATAAGIRAFAFNLHSMYLETNVRTVFLHELFPGAVDVPDKVLAPLVDLTCPQDDTDPKDTPRIWYYALLDYGAYLKKIVPNPSRRSKTHTKQSKFEGSHRQRRAEVVRLMLDNKELESSGMSFDEIHDALNAQEMSAGRPSQPTSECQKILDELLREGFCKTDDDLWYM